MFYPNAGTPLVFRFESRSNLNVVQREISWLCAILAVSIASLSCDNTPPPVRVLTYQYDSTRDGANTRETVLTPANVNVSRFGKLFSDSVDGYVYAQPLYAGQINIAG